MQREHARSRYIALLWEISVTTDTRAIKLDGCNQLDEELSSGLVGTHRECRP